ncbi:hypothetical protein LTR37_012627 [Vermiconidia calcicola]|uniref:Uncharacterized protein n=1 Tax=Vermiconidia calcicola TaxID=1690605 RepID=A0ACC3N1H2_9PEZI|nr:hypothetical protein LTR37_012627 [Vermiconidia calcicola]
MATKLTQAQLEALAEAKRRSEAAATQAGDASWGLVRTQDGVLRAPQDAVNAENGDFVLRGPFKIWPLRHPSPCGYCYGQGRGACYTTYIDCANYDLYAQHPTHPCGPRPKKATPGAVVGILGACEEWEIVHRSKAHQPAHWYWGTWAWVSQQRQRQQLQQVQAQVHPSNHGQQMQPPAARGAQPGPSGYNVRPPGQQQSREGGSNRGPIPPEPTGQVTQHKSSGDPKGRQGAPRDGKKGQGSGGARPHLR